MQLSKTASACPVPVGTTSSLCCATSFWLPLGTLGSGFVAGRPLGRAEGVGQPCRGAAGPQRAWLAGVRRPRRERHDVEDRGNTAFRVAEALGVDFGRAP